MSQRDVVRSVLRSYGASLADERIESLGSAGGFSGARFWRLTTDSGTLCLRRWPQGHPSPPRLLFIHQTLRHVAERAELPLASPRYTDEGLTFLSMAGHLWQLEPWLPGVADYRQRPSDRRLVAAMEMLATFHRAAASHSETAGRRGPPPAVADRLKRIAHWTPQRLADLGERTAADADPRLAAIAERAAPLVMLYRQAAPGVESELRQIADVELPLAPCLRDIHDEHVLFVDEAVSGVIDFGALRVDHTAIDVARLLGSLAGDDEDRWRRGCDVYDTSRGDLAPLDRPRVRLLDRATTLLSGLNWLEWVFTAGRQFEDYDVITERLRRIERRLRVAAEAC
ncbi:MAG: aminoglycoside phosphotransferase family protein [Planctomycetota bacterium]|nr:MAG: aminoglycoside phosphotransferase family protein [Planctomycetota bacterium]REK31226.1 MAG: aminoglycoside phosphotransferase family protein [Planctomycetota bacterium]REK43564.1 MAG: aminoglycoside phosphotransferase family protein [Planctomycetota bacterium]